MNVTAVLNFRSHELKELEQKHFWHVSDKKRDRVCRHAFVDSLSHFIDIQAECEYKSCEVFLALYLRNNVIKSDRLVDSKRIEIVSVALISDVGVDYEAFSRCSSELGTVRTEADVFDAHS